MYMYTKVVFFFIGKFSISYAIHCQDYYIHDVVHLSSYLLQLFIVLLEPMGLFT